MPTLNIDGRELRKARISRQPIVIDLADMHSSLDKEVRKLQKISIKDNPNNREIAFWNDSVSQSFAHITAAEIIGDGLKIRCENAKAQRLIQEFCRQINVRRETIEDYITSSWFDSIVHGKSYWRVLRDEKLPYKVDIQRLDPKSISIVEDPKRGWRAFVQDVGNYKSYSSKYSFYRNANKSNVKQVIRDSLGRPYGNFSSPNPVIIPDEPHRVIYTNFFYKPPVSTVIHFIIYKRWIALFMKKYSQKHWAPFIIASIGDRDRYPESPEEMQEAIDYTAQQLQKIASFGASAFPGNVTVKSLETATARSSEIYVTYMKHLNKEIMMGMYGSMGLREASGSELATSRILEHGRLRFLNGMRRRFELKLTNFFANCLLPYNHINGVSQSDIDIEFSPLRADAPESLMSAVFRARQVGAFKDKNELRKACQGIWDFLEDLPSGENEPLEDSMPGGGLFGGSSKQGKVGLLGNTPKQRLKDNKK